MYASIWPTCFALGDQSRFLTKANGIHTLQMGLVSIPFFSHWHHGPMGTQSRTPSTPRLALADFGAVPKGVSERI